MKNLILSLVISCAVQNIYSQVNYSQFMPLNVGNIWVYECSTNGSFCGGCTGRTKMVITKDTVVNGKTYYYCQLTSITLNGNCNWCGGAIPYSWIRVDPQSFNLKLLGPNCPWSPNEVMLDSFKTSLHDSISVNCMRPTQWEKYVCTDTNNIVLFGLSRQRRTYTDYQFEGGSSRIYAYGIGLDSSTVSGLDGGTFVCTRRNILKGCIINGFLYGDTSMLLSINRISSEIPNSFSLLQNYPNPFNPTTKIKFDIPAAGQRHAFDVQMKIYDALGREVAMLVDQQMQSGSYSVDWDASNYPSGVYFYKLVVGDNTNSNVNFTKIKKMMLIK